MKALFALRSIRHKLLVGVLLTTATALLILGAIFIAYDLEDYRNRIVDELTTQADLLSLGSTAALEFEDRDTAQQALASLRLRPEVRAAAIYDKHGNLFARYYSAPGFIGKIPARSEGPVIEIDSDTVRLFRPIYTDREIAGSVYLLAQSGIQERTFKVMMIFISVAVLALVASTLLSSWLQARITHPIMEVTDLARQVVNERNYDLRANRTTEDEIGFLIEAFNQMLSQIGLRTSELERSNNRLAQEINERMQAVEEINRLNEELEHRVQERTAELENANKELESFSYSVSHDLRAPLRSIDGFSQALLEDYGEQLDSVGKDYLNRVRNGAQRMGRLIDDMLNLSRVSRMELVRRPLNLSEVAVEILADLQRSEPQRKVSTEIDQELLAYGDTRLVGVALENLLSNAWKYTAKRDDAWIRFGQTDIDGHACFFVRDNGAGFDMQYADRLFTPFQRLHDTREFPGTGVGLATVQRVIRRHGGRIWADSKPGEGSTFYFTLNPPEELNHDTTSDSSG